MNLKIASSMITVLFTLVIFNPMLSVSASMAPVAIVDSNQDVNIATPVTLDGIASYDPDDNEPLRDACTTTSKPEGNDVQLIVTDGLNKVSAPASTSLPLFLLLNTAEKTPSCNTCRRYLGFVKCAQYPKGIPRVYIRGDKECPKYRERNDVTD